MDCNYSETIADKYGNMNKKTKSIPAKRRRGHSLTACNVAPPATPNRPLNPKWPPGSGKRLNLRLFDPPINFR